MELIEIKCNPQLKATLKSSDSSINYYKVYFPNNDYPNLRRNAKEMVILLIYRTYVSISTKVRLNVW